MPPHERTWRHPSELAAQEHALARTETAAATTRAFAFTTGTLGLLAVGVLMLAVTPDRSASPVAISATTTPTVGATATSVAATVATSRNPVALRGQLGVHATPIGEGRFAVVTAADLAATTRSAAIGDAVEVAVPSGNMHDARIVGRAGDTVLVELQGTEPGVEVADQHPAGHEIVTVLAEPPVTIALDDLHGLDVAEGTAVLDDDGDLVGLCTDGGEDTTRLLAVTGGELDDGTDAARPSDELVAATTDG